MKIISLINMKGGVAKTTLAVNLADVLVERHSCSVLLIDVDPQFNATQCLISGEEYVAHINNDGYTIVDIFDDNARPTASVVKGASESKPLELADIKPYTVKDNFDLIPGDLELCRLDMVSGQGREFLLKRYLEEINAEDEYDFIIIDTPPTPSSWMFSALIASDGYIVPVKPEPMSRRGVDLLKGVIDRISKNYGKTIQCLGVVLTIANPHLNVYQDTVDFFDNNEIWKGKRFNNILLNRTKIALEQGNQKLILEVGDSDSKKYLVGIVNEFLKKV